MISHRLWTMMLGIFLGTYAGAGLLIGEASELAATALGLALVAYAVVRSYRAAGLRPGAP